jgi:hypothetical protein
MKFIEFVPELLNNWEYTHYHLGDDDSYGFNDAVEHTVNQMSTFEDNWRLDGIHLLITKLVRKGGFTPKGGAHQVTLSMNARAFKEPDILLGSIAFTVIAADENGTFNFYPGTPGHNPI